MEKSIDLSTRLDTFSVKIKTDQFQIGELLNFISLNPIIRPGKNITAPEALVFKQIKIIHDKLYKRLFVNHTKINTIRLNYYELITILAFYQGCFTEEIRVNYPQLVQLVVKVDQALVSFNIQNQL